MSSLLAYGQGFLTGDIGAGAGLTEPWAQSFGWGDGGATPMDQDPGCGSEEGLGASDFFSLIQEGAPKEEEVPLSPSLSRCPTKKELHWDSPIQSPSTPFVHLPYSVLQIVVTGTKADAVIVGVFQDGSVHVVETLLHLPKSLNFGELPFELKPELLPYINGKVKFTENLDLPVEFTRALGKRPRALVAHHFSLEKYRGIVFSLWHDEVPATAEAVFADAVHSLPMLLSNRINARKYEHLGRRFDAILKVMPEAVVFVDDKCAQVVINPAAAALLDLPSHGEVDPSKVAHAMRKLTERCSARTDPQHWMRLLSADEEREIEEDWELKDPRRVLHVRSYPVSSHSAHGRLWLYEDVTAPRDAEEAIEAANRGKSQFLAMMSHELRTPMTGVLGMLDLLQLTSLVPEQQGLMKIMQECAEGLMDVINNILDYCKIEAGRLILEEIDFSLSDIFKQIHELSKKHLLEKGLELKMVPQPGTRDVVRGDPVRLRQILRNLVSNAIKFTDQGSVTVSWCFLDSQCFDSTISETSPSPVRRSDYLNRLIQARQDKCVIKHTTSPSGQSTLTVDCSGRCHMPSVTLPSPVSKSVSLSTPQESNDHSQRKGLSSCDGASAELRIRRKPLGSDALRTSDPGQSFNKSCSAASGETCSVSSSLTIDNDGMEIWNCSNAPETTLLLSSSDMAPGELRIRRKRLASVALGTSDVGQSFSKRSSAASGETCSLSSCLTSDDGVETSNRSNLPETMRVSRPATNMASLSHEKTGFRSAKFTTISPEHSIQAKSSLAGSQSHCEVSYGAAKDLSEKEFDSLLQVQVQSADSANRQRLDIPDSHCSIIKKAVEQYSASAVPSGVVADRRSRTTSSDAFGDRFCSIPDPDTRQESPPSGSLQQCKGSDGGIYRESSQKVGKVNRPDEKVWLEVQVSDTGVGMVNEQLQKLFVASQAGSQRRDAAGTGLGLAICKGLLGLLGGKLQFDSKVGEGTTVTVTVPLLLPAEEAVEVLVESVVPVEKLVPTESSSVQERRPKASTVENSRINVLVAEDNVVNQLLIRKMFRHYGHVVDVVGNGKLAVEAVQKKVFDLVLMDVQMPILDGLSATKAIRALPKPTSSVPIYALSADTPGSGPMEETGLDGYLCKPIAWEKISGLVERIIAAKNNEC